MAATDNWSAIRGNVGDMVEGEGEGEAWGLSVDDAMTVISEIGHELMATFFHLAINIGSPADSRPTTTPQRCPRNYTGMEDIARLRYQA